MKFHGFLSKFADNSNTVVLIEYILLFFEEALGWNLRIFASFFNNFANFIKKITLALQLNIIVGRWNFCRRKFRAREQNWKTFHAQTMYSYKLGLPWHYAWFRPQMSNWKSRCTRVKPYTNDLRLSPANFLIESHRFVCTEKAIKKKFYLGHPIRHTGVVTETQVLPNIKLIKRKDKMQIWLPAQFSSSHYLSNRL